MNVKPEVQWTSRALRQLKRIDFKEQDKIVDAVDDLEKWPNCQHVKALVGREDYRLRVGRYRVIFTVNTQKQPVIIKIEEVKKRDGRTYEAPNHS